MNKKISLIGAGSGAFSLSLIRDRIVPREIELEAYRLGSKKLLVELVCLDPWTRNLQQAQDFVNEILAMPHHEKMKEHYV